MVQEVETKKKNEIIYIFTNEAIPDYVKIGKTTSLEQRLRSLYRTSVPLPFVCFYACTVKNAKEVEKWLFNIFKDSRVSKDREFFTVSPESVVEALKEKEIEDITPPHDYVESKEDQEALNQARNKGGRFNFKMFDIPVGSTLIFTRNGIITCTVLANNKVKFQGQELSISEAAAKALQGGYPVNGTFFWKYKGETLNERRKRFERGE